MSTHFRMVLDKYSGVEVTHITGRCFIFTLMSKIVVQFYIPTKGYESSSYSIFPPIVDMVKLLSFSRSNSCKTNNEEQFFMYLLSFRYLFWLSVSAFNLFKSLA